MAKSRNKPGPKPKIDAAAETRIIDILTACGTLKDACGVLGIDTSTLRRYRLAHPEFTRRVIQAEKEGKLKLIRRVGDANAWQAAAWLLERKFGAEFGRRETIKQEITGKDGGPIRQETTIDLTKFTDEELLKFEEAAAGRANRISTPSRN